MDKETFQLALDNIEDQARVNIKGAESIDVNPRLNAIAQRDPQLGKLLREGVAQRAKNSQAILDHIGSRREKTK